MFATFLHPFETRKIDNKRNMQQLQLTFMFRVPKRFCASLFFLAFTLSTCKNCHIIAVVKNMLVTGHFLQMQFVSLFNLNLIRNSNKNRKVVYHYNFFFGANFHQSFPKNRNDLLTSSRKTVIKFFRCQKRFIIIIKNFFVNVSLLVTYSANVFSVLLDASKCIFFTE